MASKKTDHPMIAFLPQSRAIIEITTSNTQKTRAKASKDGLSYEKFGANDKLPDEILDAIWSNASMPQLLDTAAEFLHGLGLGVFRKRLVPGTDKQEARELIEPVYDVKISEWFEKMNLRRKWVEMCMQYVTSGNVYLGVNLNAFAKPVQMRVYDWPSIRAGWRDDETGQINEYILFGDRRVDGKSVKAQAIPRYYRGIEKHDSQFIYHVAKPTSGQMSYGVPSWFGALETIKVLNKIPKFHGSGIDNGYNVKYHVRIPDTYLNQFGDRNSAERKRAWDQLQENMDKTLSGAENVNKAILTEFIVDVATGKPLPGVDIQSLENNPSDKSYLDLNKDFKIDAGSSVGINPALANVDTGGKLSSSASELRTAAQLHMMLKTPIPRMLLLEPLNIVFHMAGFDKNLFLMAKDFQLTTLDQNPTGVHKVVQNAS